MVEGVQVCARVCSLCVWLCVLILCMNCACFNLVYDSVCAFCVRFCVHFVSDCVCSFCVWIVHVFILCLIVFILCMIVCVFILCMIVCAFILCMIVYVHFMYELFSSCVWLCVFILWIDCACVHFVYDCVCIFITGYNLTHSVCVFWLFPVIQVQ